MNGRFQEDAGTGRTAEIVKEIRHRQVYDFLQGRKPRATGDGLWGKRFWSGWQGTAMTSAINSDEPRCDNREELQAWIWAGTVG